MSQPLFQAVSIWLILAGALSYLAIEHPLAYSRLLPITIMPILVAAIAAPIGWVLALRATRSVLSKYLEYDDWVRIDRVMDRLDQAAYWGLGAALLFVYAFFLTLLPDFMK